MVMRGHSTNLFMNHRFELHNRVLFVAEALVSHKNDTLLSGVRDPFGAVRPEVTKGRVSIESYQRPMNWQIDMHTSVWV